ncbi:MAG: hypothetical protein ACRBCJ_10960 [Hyphomicrobiaceae bacterium]
MTEAELLQLSFQTNAAMMDVFSMFFGIVSAYLAGLYFFLHASPQPIKILAFGLLTVAFLFLGQTMAGIEMRAQGIISAWGSLENPVTGIEGLSQLVMPLPIKMIMHDQSLATASYDGFTAGSITGWVVALLVYVALAYLTFIYRWPIAKG